MGDGEEGVIHFYIQETILCKIRVKFLYLCSSLIIYSFLLQACSSTVGANFSFGFNLLSEPSLKFPV